MSCAEWLQKGDGEGFAQELHEYNSAYNCTNNSKQDNEKSVKHNAKENIKHHTDQQLERSGQYQEDRGAKLANMHRKNQQSALSALKQTLLTSDTLLPSKSSGMYLMSAKETNKDEGEKRNDPRKRNQEKQTNLFQNVSQ